MHGRHPCAPAVLSHISNQHSCPTVPAALSHNERQGIWKVRGHARPRKLSEFSPLAGLQWHDGGLLTSADPASCTVFLLMSLAIQFPSSHHQHCQASRLKFEFSPAFSRSSLLNEEACRSSLSPSCILVGAATSGECAVARGTAGMKVSVRLAGGPDTERTCALVLTDMSRPEETVSGAAARWLCSGTCACGHGQWRAVAHLLCSPNHACLLSCGGD